MLLNTYCGIGRENWSLYDTNISVNIKTLKIKT
jgi:hypothetical protein